MNLGDPPWRAEDVACYLRVTEKTVRNWTSRRQIPFTRVGGRVYYLKTEIDRHLLKQSMPTEDIQKRRTKNRRQQAGKE